MKIINKLIPALLCAIALLQACKKDNAANGGGGGSTTTTTTVTDTTIIQPTEPVIAKRSQAWHFQPGYRNR
jgi:hypothetical protein